MERGAINGPSCLALVICEHLAVLLPDGDEELVDAHGRVDGDFSAEESFDVMFLWRREVSGRESYMNNKIPLWPWARVLI